jgi:hypothetical protein
VADHYTLRLAPGVQKRLSERARRAGLQERTLAQRYVEEGQRHDAHPLIQFLDGPSGRRASLLGRGLNVWEVIATIRDNNGSMAEAAGQRHGRPERGPVPVRRGRRPARRGQRGYVILVRGGSRPAGSG